MLLPIHIKDYQPRKVVQYFEVVKEKAPELVIPLRRAAGRSAGPTATSASTSGPTSSGAGVVEASYLEDARVGEVLRQRGKTLEGDRLPARPLARVPRHGVDRERLLRPLAGPRRRSPARRSPTRPSAASWPTPGVTRSELLLQAIRLIQVVPRRSRPKNPLADEASLALVGDVPRAGGLRRGRQALGRGSPGSTPRARSSTASSTARRSGEFHLGQYDRAIEVAEAIAGATYKDANGVDQPSPNKWQALYILGQIYDARRQPGEGRRATTSRSPTGSPTPPARSRR